MDAIAETVLAPERFARSSSRRLALAYVDGLLAGPPSRSTSALGRSLEGRSPEADPAALRRLVHSLAWDRDGVRDDLRDHVVSTLARGTEVWALTAAGFPKSGTRSVGTEVQDLGDGRPRLGQRGVFLTYATPNGHALVDRELHLPDAWVTDEDRRRSFDVPDDVVSTTPGGLAVAMLERARTASGLRGAVAVDAVVGRDPDLWDRLVSCRVPTVVQIAPGGGALVDGRGWTDWLGEVAGFALQGGARSWHSDEVDPVRGARSVEWAVVDLRPGIAGGLPSAWGHWLILRWTRTHRGTEGATCFRAAAPAHLAVTDLVRASAALAAGHQAVATARARAGLDAYQVRHHPGWYRHVTLAMVAAAHLELGSASSGASRRGGAAASPGVVPSAPWSRLRPAEPRKAEELVDVARSCTDPVGDRSHAESRRSGLDRRRPNI